MTIAQYRRIALSMPEAVESAHMGHPDFRVKGKIFATLFPVDNKIWGVLKLKPDQQRQFIKSHPDMFQPVKGGWGKQGATQVRLTTATTAVIRSAMTTAWRNTAPKSLLDQHGLSDKD